MRFTRTCIMLLILLPLLAGNVSAEESTTNGVKLQLDVQPRAPGLALQCSQNVGILGGYFSANMTAFLQANGHVVTQETQASIAGGALANLDVLYLNRSGTAAATAEAATIEAWVRAGGILITEYTATDLLLDGTFGFFPAATLDTPFGVPSGTVCGGNTVNVDNPSNAVATGLPASWSCSGDPIGVFNVWDQSTLDSSIDLLASTPVDQNTDGFDDPVVGSACPDAGALVMFFTDFGDWQPLENPRTCPNPPCNRSIEDETLMLNAVCLALDNCAIQVDIDIKFCSDPNAFNCKKKGVLPVTIFGTASFSVADIDPSTLRLCLADLSACTNGPKDWSIADRGDPSSDLGAAQCALVDTDGDGIPEEQDYLNPDGFDDLDAAFEASEVQGILGAFCGGPKGGTSPSLVIVGQTFGGTDIFSLPVNDEGIDQLVKANK